MLLYHKKYDKSIKLLKKTKVYLNSLEVCNIIPIYLLYITHVPHITHVPAKMC